MGSTTLPQPNPMVTKTKQLRAFRIGTAMDLSSVHLLQGTLRHTGVATDHSCDSAHSLGSYCAFRSLKCINILVTAQLSNGWGNRWL